MSGVSLFALVEVKAKKARSSGLEGHLLGRLFVVAEQCARKTAILGVKQREVGHYFDPVEQSRFSRRPDAGP
jgi:hypothetical protein